uniref:Uncharacterized protein n=1 Tax=viral metagenome TaxID=1070528 RepID=A0A6C0JWK6_9ZZZZ
MVLHEVEMLSQYHLGSEDLAVKIYFSGPVRTTCFQYRIRASTIFVSSILEQNSPFD